MVFSLDVWVSRGFLFTPSSKVRSGLAASGSRPQSWGPALSQCECALVWSAERRPRRRLHHSPRAMNMKRAGRRDSANESKDPEVRVPGAPGVLTRASREGGRGRGS